MAGKINPKSKTPRWARFTALLLLINFLLTQSVSAAPGMSGADALRLLSGPGFDAKILAENPFGIQLDEKEGRVAGFFDGNPGLPLVIYLQDAHGNISAQQNVRKVISKILADPRFSAENIFCLLEGAEGFVSRAPLTAFLKQGIDPRAALLSKAMINGPELAATDSPKLALWGIEDLELYGKNRDAWLLAHRRREINHLFLDPFAKLVGDLLHQEASRPLRELLKAEEAFQAGDGELDKAAKFLKKFIRIYRREMETANADKPLSAADLKKDFPNVYRFMQLEYLWEEARSELENYHDQKQKSRKKKQRGRTPSRFEKAPAQQREQSHFDARPRKGAVSLSPEKSQKGDLLVSPPAAVSSRQELSLLPETIPSQESAQKTFQNFLGDLFESSAKKKTSAALEKYLNTTEEIDSFELWNEFKGLMRALKEKFYGGASLRSLDRLNEKMSLLAKLVDLNLTPQEYERLRSLGAADRRALTAEFKRIARQNEASSVRFEKLNLTGAAWEIQGNWDYYETAKARDQKLFSNLGKFLIQHRKTPVVFLFTGGFHTPGITHRLRKKGISYVTIQPSISSISEADDLRYEKALDWQRSLLAIRTALSASPRALVHEIGIPLIARQVLSAAPGNEMSAYQETLAALAAAYDQEIQNTVAPQLSALGSVDVQAELSQRREEFVAALSDLRPVFEKLTAMKASEGVNLSQKTIRIEMGERALVLNLPANAVSVRLKKAKSVEKLETAGASEPEVQGNINAKGVFIREDLGGDDYEQAFNHEVRVHVNMESARREKPALVENLLARLNSLSKNEREKIKELFYQIRIAPQMRMRKLAPQEITKQITESKSVMPENPEIWSRAVRDTEAGPVFSVFFLDELLAEFLSLTAQFTNAEFAAIQSQKDYRLRASAGAETQKQYFEMIRSTVAADTGLLREMGFFDGAEEVMSKDVEGAYCNNRCYEVVRRQAYASIFSDLNIPEGEALSKLFGTDPGIESTGDKEKDGILAWYSDRFIDDFLNLVPDLAEMMRGLNKPHEMSKAIELVALEYFENATSADSWTFDDFVDRLVTALYQEIGEFFTEDELRRLLDENPGLLSWLRELFGELKGIRGHLDSKYPSWREKLLKYIKESGEGGGGHHVEPVRRQKDVAAPGQPPQQTPQETPKQAPQQAPPPGGPRSEARAWITSSAFGLLAMTEKVLRSEVRTEAEDDSEPKGRNWDKLKEYSIERLMTHYPDLSREQAEKVFYSWVGLSQKGDASLYHQIFDSQLNQKPGGIGGRGYLDGSNLYPGDISLALGFFDFMNPDVDRYRAAVGRFLPEGSAIQRSVRSLTKRQKRVLTVFGNPGVGKSHLMKGIAKHILSDDFSQGGDPKWLFFKFNKRKFFKTAAALQAMQPGVSIDKVFAQLNEVFRKFLNRPNVLLFIDEAHELAKVKTGAINNFYNDLKPELADDKSYIRFFQFTTSFEYSKYLKGNESDPNQRRREEMELAELELLHTRQIVLDEMKMWDDPEGKRADEENILEKNGIKIDRAENGQASIADEVLDLKRRFSPEWASPAKELALLASLVAKIIAFIQDLVIRFKREPKDLARLLNFYIGERQLEKKQKVSPDLARALKPDDDKKVLVEHILQAVRTITKAWTLANERRVTVQHLYESLSEDQNIPLSMLNFQEEQDPEKIKEKLKEVVIGQDEAVDELVDAYVAYLEVKKNNPNYKEPFAAFLGGPSRTGKTYFGNVWAKIMLGNANAVETVGMAAYSQPHTVAKMQGSPPGYIGSENPGLFTQLFRKHNSVFSMILDEIEKAHPRVYDYLLPALRPGELEDMQRNKTVWRNVAVFLTSNLGMTDPESDKDKSNRAKVEKVYDLLRSGDEDQLAFQINKVLMKVVEDAVRDFMRPEFMNRLTLKHPVFFKWLHPDAARELIDRVLLKELIKDFSARGIQLDFELAKKQKIKAKSSEQFIEDKLVEQIADGVKDKDGKLYLLDSQKAKLWRVDGAKMSWDLEAANPKALIMKEIEGKKTAFILHDQGILKLNLETGEKNTAAEEAGITSFAVNSKGEAIWIKDGKINGVSMPAGITAREVVISHDRLFMTDGKQIYILRHSEGGGWEILQGDKGTAIRDLQVDETGRIFYLTEQETTHLQIDSETAEKEIQEELRELARTQQALLKGGNEFLEHKEKDADGREIRKIYQRQSVYELDAKGKVKLLAGEPVRSREYEEYEKLKAELIQLKEKEDELRKQGIVKDSSTGKAWDEVKEKIDQVQRQMSERFQTRGVVGFGTAAPAEFYVRLSKNFEERYDRWQAERDKVREKHGQGVNSKEVKEKSSFLVMLAPDGSLLQSKDLAFRNVALYETGEKKSRRDAGQKKFGALPENIRLKKDAAGRLSLIDLNRRTTNQLDVFEYSELADYLVLQHYDNAFEGISALQKGFRDWVREAINKKNLNFGEGMTVRFISSVDELGKTRGSLKFENVRKLQDIGTESLVPATAGKEMSPEEFKIIQKIDAVIKKNLANGSSEVFTDAMLMQIMESTLGIDVIDILNKLNPEISVVEPYFNSAEFLEDYRGEKTPKTKNDPNVFHGILEALPLETKESFHQIFEHAIKGLPGLALESLQNIALRDRGVSQPFKEVTDKNVQREVTMALLKEARYAAEQRWGLLNQGGRLSFGYELAFQGYLTPEERLEIKRLLELDIRDEETYHRYAQDTAYPNKSLLKVVFYLKQMGLSAQLLTQTEKDVEGNSVFFHRIQVLVPLGILASLPDAKAPPKYKFEDKPIPPSGGPKPSGPSAPKISPDRPSLKPLSGSDLKKLKRRKRNSENPKRLLRNLPKISSIWMKRCRRISINFSSITVFVLGPMKSLFRMIKPTSFGRST